MIGDAPSRMARRRPGTVYLGSLRGGRIPHFRSPVAGLPLMHW